MIAWVNRTTDPYGVDSDYASNAGLDTYSEAGIDDRSSIPEMSRQQRLAAERAMQRRDRGIGGGARAARRSRAPAFLQSDDEEDTGVGHGLLDGISTRRRRRQYDERPDQDDVEGGDEVSHNFGLCAGMFTNGQPKIRRKSHWNISVTLRQTLLRNG